MRRNDPDTFVLNESDPLPAEPDVIIAALRPLITAERYARIARVAEQRISSVTAVLDRLSDPHNVSAIIRSADAFGVPSVHVIREREEFRAARGVSRGTHRWVDVHVHEDATNCSLALHRAGYLIFVASMNAELSVEQLPATQKIALVFGNEHRGPDTQWQQLADGAFSIPMHGFVESLNVSVAAAVSLHTITRSRHAAGQNCAASNEMLARYLLRSVTNPEQALQQYLGSHMQGSATQP